MNIDGFRRLFEDVKNWGRWGADDQAGATNHITGAHVVHAASLVRSGRSISLAMPLHTTGPTPDGRPAATHLMTSTYDSFAPDEAGAFVGDYLAIESHGHASTHLDALCHMAFEGRLYNGHDAARTVTVRGAERLGVEQFGHGIVGRGVLLDVPATRGVDWLDPGDTVAPSDLELAEERAGVRVGEGDLVFVRTGRHRRWDAEPWLTRDAMPGLHVDALPWLHERRVALVGADSSNEALPSSVAGMRNPIHLGLIVAMGVPLLDNCHLEELTEACAGLGRWEFLAVVAPLRLVGGTGVAVNPLAVL